MFDLGFWELVLIASVALIVVGPEQMPQLARDVGQWLRAARRFVTQTRYEIERELNRGTGHGLSEEIAELDKLMDIAPDRDKPAGS